ncbi:hypothetical protein CDAR_505961 [Caerostris darwini]|uniref:Uncharacterized protein n=1 Tax=Caerostris darwini TaxID=1538125 RepID=A0AAV4WJD8_9ARAC|nr:hypothetical protein CDAR_505961 [Caerostris darwini]
MFPLKVLMLILNSFPETFKNFPFTIPSEAETLSQTEDLLLVRNFPRIGLCTPKGLVSVLRALVLQRQLILIKPASLKGTTIPQPCVRWAKKE